MDTTAIHQIIFLTVFCLTFTKSLHYKKGLRIDRIGECARSPNAPFRWDEVRIDNMENGISVVNSRAEVLKDLPKLLITIDVLRCVSREALDTCQPFANLIPLDTCKLINVKGAAWSPLVNAFEPPVHCPIKKSVYITRNATIDPNVAFLFPLDNWYWKLLVKVLDGKEYIDVCLDFQSMKIKY